MQATIVDLRYHMNQVLKALERNETVSVLYRGKLKGVISPATTPSAVKVTEHRFFGCRKDTRPVEDVMEQLRGGRHGDL
jgi:antitoxin (DNA-binding transcriptional repressor) of toxin-antitoxin stability system